MTLTKWTKRWLAALAIAFALIVIDGGDANRLGFLGALAWMTFVAACLVLGFRVIRSAFRLVVRRLTLRLAFSYFLIGIVPIPLLATLAFVLFYVVAHQFVATRVWRETTEIANTATGLPALQVRDGKVVRSDVSWLEPGQPAPWVSQLDRPRALIEAKNVWIAVRDDRDAGSVRLLHLNDPSGAWLKKLADRTGYAIRVEIGRAQRGRRGFEMNVGSRRTPSKEPTAVTVRPSALPAPTKGREWIGAVYVEPAAAIVNATVNKENTVVFIATTSPQVVFEQLFTQGIPRIARIFRVVTMGLAAALLFVYLVALALAFVLVSTITRNVNRMSRAAEGIARGDFSVRVNTKSRDQIGDLARSFDGMADSIQKLLVDTARKERLEAEIAVARTIQQKLLPPPSATLDGARILAHVRSVAEIGGDYYDYLPMPDGRSAIVVGDVSGHGLPTGLLVAMAKAGLATLIETGLTGPPLFTRLNDLIHRSTDSRNYMTLALLVYDAKSRRGELTNAGQLAPYRVSKGKVESLSLPSFPLGASARSEFPTRTWDFAAGDTVVLLTDGLVECLSPAGEPFGFERFEAILARESASPPDRLRDAILGEIDAYTGGAAPDDDRTLVIVTLD
ncbi:MAG TPA: SpoIIE family protein phosphatase [Thermoanaerobaculia bacterium]|nr:SpoIIE family protein phosphatase [Thermoanaerobaculia bacterium]